jgi:hypothetical protein
MIRWFETAQHSVALLYISSDMLHKFGWGPIQTLATTEMKLHGFYLIQLLLTPQR